MTSPFKIERPIADASKMRQWLDTRGGIAIWKSINLSNPGTQWLMPADVTEKPSWQCANDPEIVTSAADVGIYTETLYKAFRVSLRQAGMAFKLTDHSQKRLDNWMAKCEKQWGNAHYRRAVLDVDYPNMGVFYTNTIKPLSEID